MSKKNESASPINIQEIPKIDKANNSVSPVKYERVPSKKPEKSTSDKNK